MFWGSQLLIFWFTQEVCLRRWDYERHASISENLKSRQSQADSGLDLNFAKHDGGKTITAYQLSLQLSLTKYFPLFSARTNSTKQFRPTNICNICLNLNHTNISAQQTFAIFASTTQIFQPYKYLQYFPQLHPYFSLTNICNICLNLNHKYIPASQISARFPSTQLP